MSPRRPSPRSAVGARSKTVGAKTVGAKTARAKTARGKTARGKTAGAKTGSAGGVRPGVRQRSGGLAPGELLETHELTPELWPALERLFGPGGACAGCWCMWWRIEDGERFDDVRGNEAKRRQKALVLEGSSRGVLAFAGDEPVGWCAYARRTELVRLARSRALACDDAEQVWSVPCFFIKAGWRGRGVARALLRHALVSIRAEGGRVAEAYPIALRKNERATNAAAFTGTVPFLESEGFVVVARRPRGRQRARKVLS